MMMLLTAQVLNEAIAMRNASSFLTNPLNLREDNKDEEEVDRY